MGFYGDQSDQTTNKHISDDVKNLVLFSLKMSHRNVPSTSPTLFALVWTTLVIERLTRAKLQGCIAFCPEGWLLMAFHCAAGERRNTNSAVE
jgi:hypothetical protein